MRELLHFVNHQLRPQYLSGMVCVHICDLSRSLCPALPQRIPINNEICRLQPFERIACFVVRLEIFQSSFDFVQLILGCQCKAVTFLTHNAGCLIYVVFYPLRCRPAVLLFQPLCEFSTSWPQPQIGVLRHDQDIHCPAATAHQENALRRYRDRLAATVLRPVDAKNVQRFQRFRLKSVDKTIPRPHGEHRTVEGGSDAITRHLKNFDGGQKLAGLPEIAILRKRVHAQEVVLCREDHLALPRVENGQGRGGDVDETALKRLAVHFPPRVV